MAKKAQVSRDDDISSKPAIKKKLLKVFAAVSEGFVNQGSRSDDQMDYWDVYNCELNRNQIYNGTTKVYVPIVSNAVDARKTRFVNQIMPKTGRYVEVMTEDGEIPHAEMALIENYVDRTMLRTKVLPALCRNGDIEGQYNLYVSWSKRARHVAWREKEPLKYQDEAGRELGEGLDEIETVKESVILDECPDVEVLSDCDVLILPVTCDTIEEALEVGGSVTILRRWTKEQIEQAIDDEDIVETQGEALLKEMKSAEKGTGRNAIKKHADAAGIREKGRDSSIYETWTKLKVDGQKRLCRAFYGGGEIILGCKLNPYWCDRVPVITHPVEKVSGVIKGVSKVKKVAQLQYSANDIVMEGMDSATYSMLPIIMTDPLKNPKIGSMILDLAAVWETNPNDTKFASFPPLFKDAFEVVAAAKSEIFQTLGVNPAMMPQQTGNKAKRNQAEIANEQQVDILTTADAVTVLENGILTPLMERFAEYDAQFRTRTTTVPMYGRLGIKLMMQEVEPISMGKRYRFRWFGVEQARNAAAIQQQIAMMNVLRGIPPQMMPGRRIDLVPAVEQLVENTFGPRLAPLIFVDLAKELSVDAEIENEILTEGSMMPVSPYDDDQQHLQLHQQAAQKTGDTNGLIRAHMMKHQQSLSMKQQAAAQAEMQQQAGGTGAPGGAAKGVAGQPKPGAQPAPPRGNKGPPGMIPPESMAKAGAAVMPRKM